VEPRIVVVAHEPAFLDLPIRHQRENIGALGVQAQGDVGERVDGDDIADEYVDPALAGDDREGLGPGDGPAQHFVHRKTSRIE
jgi:hypothetical protein